MTLAICGRMAGATAGRRCTKRRDGASRGEFFGTDAAGDALVNRKDYGRKQKKRGLFTSWMPCRVDPEKARSELRPVPQRRHE